MFPIHYRKISKNLHVGGHPMLNCLGEFDNNYARVTAILKTLKSKGIKTIVCLTEKKLVTQKYRALVEDRHLKFVSIPLYTLRTPPNGTWTAVEALLGDKPIYVHCKWGEDRTGAIIARYLVEVEHYTPKRAWLSVIKGGKYSANEGLKQRPAFRNLVSFFWPAYKNDPKVNKIYAKSITKRY